MNKTQKQRCRSVIPSSVTHPPRVCIRIQARRRRGPLWAAFAPLCSRLVFWELLLSSCCLVIALFFWDFFRFIYETEHFNGVAELLEILGRFVPFASHVCSTPFQHVRLGFQTLATNTCWGSKVTVASRGRRKHGGKAKGGARSEWRVSQKRREEEGEREEQRREGDLHSSWW